MRILIVRTDRLGDVVLTLPMAQAISSGVPGTEIEFLVSDYTAPLVSMAPSVDSVAVVRANASLMERVRLFRRSKAQVVFFPNASFGMALAAALARIPKRVGTAYRWYSWLFTDRIRDHRRDAERHETEYNLRMLGAIGIDASNSIASLHIPESSVLSTKAWLESEQIGMRYAVLHIPSGGSSKDWPTDRFVKLGQRLGLVNNLAIVLTGTPAEAEFLFSVRERIRNAYPSVHMFVGRPIEELAALLSMASLVASNSTGPGHLAAALGTPAIGLFPLPRALSKERWGLRGQRARNVAPDPKEGCPNCETCTCMERIDLERVYDECCEMLK